MKLFRFKDHNFKEIEQISLNQLDLKNKKTFFIFPGSDNASSNYPIPDNYDYEADPNKYNKIVHLLERGVIYSQDAMAANEEPFQVVVATWEGEQKSGQIDRRTVQQECSARLQKAKDDPSGFISREAQEFADELYKQPFDPNKMSVLAWSYGTCFLQECANAIRIDKKEKERLGEGATKELPPIYAVCTATVADILNSGNHGFPGFYMYAHNDKTLGKYASDLQKEIYSRLVQMTDVLNIHKVKNKDASAHLGKQLSHEGLPIMAKGSSAIIVSDKRKDQAMAVILAPNHCLISRRVPVSYEELNAGIRVKYKDATHDPSSPEFKPELITDDSCHRPGLFSMALPGSKYIEKWDDVKKSGTAVKHEKKYDASEHSRYFIRSMLNILKRQKPLNYTGMLLDESKEKELTHQNGAFYGQSPEQVTRQIRNRLANITLTPNEGGGETKMFVDVSYDEKEYDKDWRIRKIAKRMVNDDELERLRKGETIVRETGLTRVIIEPSPNGIGTAHTTMHLRGGVRPKKPIGPKPTLSEPGAEESGHDR